MLLPSFQFPLSSSPSGRATLLFWGGIVVLSIIVLTTIGWHLFKTGNGQKPQSLVAIVVNTLTLETQPIAVTYSSQGTLEAQSRIDMNVEVPGTVVDILVTEGQIVEKGQTLIRLRADRQQAQQLEAQAALIAAENLVNLRNAEINQAKARLNEAETDYQLAKSEYERYQTLRKQEFISDLELEQKQAGFHGASARLKSAHEALARANAQQKQTQAQVDESTARYRYNNALTAETVIRAPFNGMVGQRYVDVGDYILPSEKLLTLVDNRQINVVFSVPERLISDLRTGLPVNVRLDGWSNTIPGTVVFVDPVVHLENRTVALKALLKLPSSGEKFRFRDGQFGHVTLTLKTKPEGLQIPEEALVPQGEKFFSDYPNKAVLMYNKYI